MNIVFLKPKLKNYSFFLMCVKNAMKSSFGSDKINYFTYKHIVE